MELAGVLSNPQVLLELDRIVEAVARLPEHRAADLTKALPSKPPQGQILRTIKRVLTGHEDGLRVRDVLSLVEQELDRPIPKSSVNTLLLKNRSFERIGYGRYRLRH